MEPTTSLVAALAQKSGESAVDAAKQEAKGFLQKIIGPSAEAIGESFALRYRERMFNNLVEVVARAKKKLNDAGVEPREVPLKVLHPLLETSALEDEPDLQELWANLLANVANPNGSTRVSPAFALILKELRGTDAKFLEGLYTNSIGIVELQPPKGVVPRTLQDIQYSREELLKVYVKVGLSKTPHLVDISIEYYNENRTTVDADLDDFNLMMSFIKRYNILEEMTDIPPLDVSGRSSYSASKLAIEVNVAYFFSHFGDCFMRACRYPPIKS